MDSKLIIESGSTKTNMVLLLDGNQVAQCKVTGINPTALNVDEITEILQEAYNDLGFRDKIKNIYYYGAGVETELSKSKVVKAFERVFNYDNLDVNGDMLAACRAASQDNTAYVAILGTGSNCTFYDGEKMHQYNENLGFMMGDEGSGNQIGKQIIKHYFYNLMDDDLAQKFQNAYALTKEELFKKVYENSAPNKYMATFAPFAVENQDNPLIQSIVEDEFDLFVRMHLKSQPQAKNYPVHFIGSIAELFKPILSKVFDKYNLKLGEIIANPLPLLIQYHQER